MKIVINFSSFRFRIILTLIIVITTVSLISFLIYNHYLSQKIYNNAEKNLITSLSFVRDQIVAVHDGSILKECLQKMETNSSVLKACLVDGNGKFKYPADSNHRWNTLLFDSLKSLKNDITLKSYNTDSNPYARAVIRMANAPSCFACHSPDQKVIGYIAVDFSLNESEDTLIFARNSGLFFTILMVIIILGFVFFMHYKYVRNSLSQFRSTINIINQGDLSERILLPKSKELGELGVSFNEMLENFQRTQKELQKYHDQEIQNSQRMASIGEMSARLAHEIRNPITGIANAIEILNGENNNAENTKILEEIQRQANRVDKAISNLLKYARSKELNLNKGDINDIIKSVIFFLQNQSRNKSLTFIAELDPRVPVFCFDNEQVENVMLNLGMNASQACGPTGTITVRTKLLPGEKMVMIEVEDTGPGIPAEYLNEIFSPFFTTRTEGTGLGLAIAKEIIEMHQGMIRVENNPGQGCTFFISVPLRGRIPG